MRSWFLMAATPLSPLALQEAIAPCIAIALRSEAKERSREEKRNETKRNKTKRNETKRNETKRIS